MRFLHSVGLPIYFMSSCILNKKPHKTLPKTVAINGHSNGYQNKNGKVLTIPVIIVDPPNMETELIKMETQKSETDVKENHIRERTFSIDSNDMNNAVLEIDKVNEEFDDVSEKFEAVNPENDHKNSAILTKNLEDNESNVEPNSEIDKISIYSTDSESDHSRKHHVEAQVHQEDSDELSNEELVKDKFETNKSTIMEQVTNTDVIPKKSIGQENEIKDEKENEKRKTENEKYIEEEKEIEGEKLVEEKKEIESEKLVEEKKEIEDEKLVEKAEEIKSEKQVEKEIESEKLIEEEKEIESEKLIEEEKEIERKNQVEEEEIKGKKQVEEGEIEENKQVKEEDIEGEKQIEEEKEIKKTEIKDVINIPKPPPMSGLLCSSPLSPTKTFKIDLSEVNLTPVPSPKKLKPDDIETNDVTLKSSENFKEHLNKILQKRPTVAKTNTQEYIIRSPSIENLSVIDDVLAEYEEEIPEHFENIKDFKDNLNKLLSKKFVKNNENVNETMNNENQMAETLRPTRSLNNITNLIKEENKENVENDVDDKEAHKKLMLATFRSIKLRKTGLPLTDDERRESRKEMENMMTTSKNQVKQEDTKTDIVKDKENHKKLMLATLRSIKLKRTGLLVKDEDINNTKDDKEEIDKENNVK